MLFNVKRAGVKLCSEVRSIEASKLLKKISKVGLGLLVAGSVYVQSASVTEAKELSERSVQVLMNYAWAILPSKFTTQTGKVIEVDKKKRDDVMVPLPLARDIIQVARLSAHAQICELPEEQAANYRAMMKVENDKKKWSDQQLLYISQLHLFTVMWLTGNVKVTEKEGEKEITVNERGTPKKQSCTDVQKKQVKTQINAYLKSLKKPS